MGGVDEVGGQGFLDFHEQLCSPLLPIRAVRRDGELRSACQRVEEKVKVVMEEEEGCVTPKSEKNVLKPELACPPPPRKSRPAKRKLPAFSSTFPMIWSPYSSLATYL